MMCVWKHNPCKEKIGVLAETARAHRLQQSWKPTNPKICCQRPSWYVSLSKPVPASFLRPSQTCSPVNSIELDGFSLVYVNFLCFNEVYIWVVVRLWILLESAALVLLECDASSDITLSIYLFPDIETLTNTIINSDSCTTIWKCSDLMVADCSQASFWLGPKSCIRA